MKPLCGRASQWSSIITAIGCRRATAGATLRPVSGAATSSGVGLGVGVGEGVGVGVGVGSAVGVGLGVGAGLGDRDARAWLAPGFETGFVLGPTAPAANAPSPIPATPANASDQRTIDLPERVRAANCPSTCPDPRDAWACSVGTGRIAELSQP